MQPVATALSEADRKGLPEIYELGWNHTTLRALKIDPAITYLQTLYPFPGPQFRTVKDSGSAEASYYAWVDQFDTFGLGANTPIATGNPSVFLTAEPPRGIPAERRVN